MKPNETPRVEATAAVPRTARQREVFRDKIALPRPEIARNWDLGQALKRRRSVRDYAPAALTLSEVSQLLWAAEGITAPAGLRTAPSPGATFPIRSYLLAGHVTGLAAGCYGVDLDNWQLSLLLKGDKRESMSHVCGDQPCVEQCACALLLMANYRRVRKEFGDAATRLTHIEAGHIGQNWLLAATAMDLGALGVGKFDDAALRLLLKVKEEEEPVYMMLAGRRI